MQTTAHLSIQRSKERGFADHGWLQTYHSFSFADYFDPRNSNWGALRVFNDDVIAADKGFGTHPHRDMEILTYVLEGELEHKDSMGNVGVIGPGGVQYLSAGTGIAHSEYNHSAERPLHLVQMWVTPRARNLKPQYGQVDYAREERLNRWLPIATGEPNVESKIAIWQDASAYVARLENGSLDFAVRAKRFAFLFVAQGDLTANGTTLGPGDAARIAGPLDLTVAGNGEAVLWDVPPADGE
ncbi:MAG: pirin family protein [Candidatus Eremiobacteraeota bacterium]|nr:pirin family protein [Candidatus Eremiobacteraeota bacterium]